MPDSKDVVKHPWLAWLGPRLTHPRLWHINRRGISMALSVGLFFGLMVPIAQIPLAAIAAVLLRANLPLAVASTLITNPVTFAPIYYFAYQLGGLILGRSDLPAPLPEPPMSSELSDFIAIDIPDPGLFGWLAGWGDSVVHAGLPLIVGLLTLASVAAMSGYLVTSLAWRIRTIVMRRRRSRRFRQLRAAARAAPETVSRRARLQAGQGQDNIERIKQKPSPRTELQDP